MDKNYWLNVWKLKQCFGCHLEGAYICISKKDVVIDENKKCIKCPYFNPDYTDTAKILMENYNLAMR